MHDLNGRRFFVSSTDASGEVNRETILQFAQRGQIVSAEYAGGGIARGYLCGTIDGDELRFRYCQVSEDGRIDGGHSRCEVIAEDGGKVRIVEHFQWDSRDESGTNVFEETWDSYVSKGRPRSLFRSRVIGFALLFGGMGLFSSLMCGPVLMPAYYFLAALGWDLAQGGAVGIDEGVLYTINAAGSAAFGAVIGSITAPVAPAGMANKCPNCDYDLIGSRSSQCPECGESIWSLEEKLRSASVPRDQSR